MFSSVRCRAHSDTCVAIFGACLAAGALFGCERKERVFELQAPGAHVEVERDVDTGEVEVEVDHK